MGAIILVLACLNCLVIEYHTFEFGRATHKHDLVVTNHPYRMIDDLLLAGALVIANASGVIAGELVGVVFLILRLIVSIYFPFYLGMNQHVHQIILIAAIIAASGILVTNFSN